MGICRKLTAEFEEKLDAIDCYDLSLHNKHSYQYRQTGNAGQMLLYFQVPATAVETGQDKCTFYPSAKRKQVAMMQADKLPSYSVFKSESLPRYVVLQSVVIVCTNDKGWIDTGLW